MSLFLSSYTNRIDRKGRVSVPGAFRNALLGQASAVILVKSPLHPALEGFGHDMVNEIARRLDSFSLFSEKQDTLASAILAQSIQLNMDSEGRIIIPADLLEYIGADEQIVFAGLGQKFQIWTPKTWEARLKHAQSLIKRDGLELPRGGTA